MLGKTKLWVQQKLCVEKFCIQENIQSNFFFNQNHATLSPKLYDCKISCIAVILQVGSSVANVILRHSEKLYTWVDKLIF